MRGSPIGFFNPVMVNQNSVDYRNFNGYSPVLAFHLARILSIPNFGPILLHNPETRLLQLRKISEPEKSIGDLYILNWMKVPLKCDIVRFTSEVATKFSFKFNSIIWGTCWPSYLTRTASVLDRRLFKFNWNTFNKVIFKQTWTGLDCQVINIRTCAR